MTVRKILEQILYFGLLAGGLIFCWSNIVEYLNGNTSYQEKQEHITFNDLPTLVVCIEKKQPNDSAWIEGRYKYGDDLMIEADEGPYEGYFDTLKRMTILIKYMSDYYFLEVLQDLLIFTYHSAF